jgi:hypothetical protein
MELPGAKAQVMRPDDFEFLSGSKFLRNDVCLHSSNHVVFVDGSRWSVRRFSGNDSAHPCLHTRLFRGLHHYVWVV